MVFNQLATMTGPMISKIRISTQESKHCTKGKTKSAHALEYKFTVPICSDHSAARIIKSLNDFTFFVPFLCADLIFSYSGLFLSGILPLVKVKFLNASLQLDLNGLNKLYYAIELKVENSL